jgi:hypothetical protein
MRLEMALGVIYNLGEVIKEIRERSLGYDIIYNKKIGKNVIRVKGSDDDCMYIKLLFQ